MKIERSPAARASARRYMNDQDGMRAIGAADIRLAQNPYPPEAFHRGDYATHVFDLEHCESVGREVGARFA